MAKYMCIILNGIKLKIPLLSHISSVPQLHVIRGYHIGQGRYKPLLSLDGDTQSLCYAIIMSFGFVTCQAHCHVNS